MIFIVANPQADGGSFGGDRSFLSQETGTFVRYRSWRNRFALFGDGSVAGFDGKPELASGGPADHGSTSATSGEPQIPCPPG
jgi:hypothetical protein